MNKQVLRWNFIFQYGYVITNIINSLILLPFYLHKIDASTLGVWLATGNILAWMTLVDPGVGDVLQQKIAELRGRNDVKGIEKAIGSGLVAASGILLIAVIAGFVFYFLIGAIINKDVTRYPNLQAALFITIISTGLSLISFSISGINQGMQNASQVAISAILANILFLVINILLLLMGFGIISIAFANLCRGLFINIYNFSALKILLAKEKIRIVFEKDHFKKFIRVFSFTSLASIIGGFSASMDTIVLARFIPPFMITIFEINKRPIQLTQSLIGRHSVALMPVVSHAAGQQDKQAITSLINIQFKYYSYLALFVASIFSFVYNDLISVWAGANKYAGNTILFLLIANFFFGLTGYFMANMGYALGDIKRNSMVNVAKGIGVGILFYPAARYFGITGILTVMLAGNILAEFLYFPYRLYKLGYLQLQLIKGTLYRWAIIIPAMFLVYHALAFAAGKLAYPNQHMIRLIFSGAAGTLIFWALPLLTDQAFRSDVVSKISLVTSRFLKKDKKEARRAPAEITTNEIKIIQRYGKVNNTA